MAACRFCRAPLSEVFADLGVSPLANSYLREDQLAKMEPFFPLKAWVCGSCMLVQLEEYETPAGIFSDYAYFSSFSTSWLAHAERYVSSMIERFGFNERSQVVEIASNDGYLLQYFVRAGVPVLGIEPAANVAEVAVAKGIPTRNVFFGRDTARDIQADLLIGNNVYAHVPDLHSFTEGLEDRAEAAGRDHARVPSSAATDGRGSVRHDLSRALLVLLALHRAAGVRALRPRRLRCRGAADTRRIAARVRLPCRQSRC